MSATEALASIYDWLNQWQSYLTELCGKDINDLVKIRLPLVAEWSASITNDELGDPRSHSRSPLRPPEEVGVGGRGAQRRIRANRNGFTNLLGNVCEVVIKRTGEYEVPYLAGFPDGVPDSIPLTRTQLPLRRFIDRSMFSFRIALEFGSDAALTEFVKIASESGIV